MTDITHHNSTDNSPKQSSITRTRGLKKRGFSFILLVLLFSCSLFFPLWAALFRPPVEFNQFLIQKLRISYGVITIEELADMTRSLYLTGLQRLFKTSPNKPSFDDEEAVFSYVFSQVPPYAVVYPTEGFYYWTTNLPEVGEISGNIRIADAHKGELSVAYFTLKPDPTERDTKFFKVKTTNGLSVLKVDDRHYDLTYKGKTVRVKNPKEEVAPHFSLTNDEESVGRIHDESGIRLHLIYNHRTHSFYEVLDEDGGLTENLEDLTENFSIGDRTGFVYFHDEDYGRQILVGVHMPNIEANNFLDGPGDQVPYWVHFKDKLNLAYPNTLLGEGTDEHGVYQGKPQWVRIAVSPYHRYSRINDVLGRKNQCRKYNKERSLYWTCLTKEWWNTPTWRKRIAEKVQAEGNQIAEGTLMNAFLDKKDESEGKA